MSKSPSLRRIQADVRELALDPSDRYYAAPLEHDMFEWHFTIRGAGGTDFDGGVYHGRILLPPEYPFKPPHIIFLTPSGRFETNTKVCLSFSAFHPELWQPAWGIRLILEALISFLPTPADGAIGALDWSQEERQRLAKLSRTFVCPTCCVGKAKVCADLLPQIVQKDGTAGTEERRPKPRFEKEIAELQRLQQVNEAGGSGTQNKVQELNASNTEETAVSMATDTVTSPRIAPETEIAAPDSCTGGKHEVAEIQTRPNQDFIETQTEKPSTASISSTAEIENEPEQDLNITEGSADTGDESELQLQGRHANDNGFPPDTTPGTDGITWIYDPLLNLMMILLAVICYLLVEKYRDLMLELEELQGH